MPAGAAGAPPCRCGSGRGSGTRLIRGRIRVPAPLVSPGVSGWRDGGALERGEGALREGDGPCNLSKSCLLRGFSVQGRVSRAPAGSARESRELPAPRVGERELLQSHVFTLHKRLTYLNSQSLQIRTLQTSTQTRNLCTALYPLLLRGCFQAKSFPFTHPGGRARPAPCRSRGAHGARGEACF